METVLHSWFAQVGLHILIFPVKTSLIYQNMVQTIPNMVRTESKHMTCDLYRFVFVMFWLRGATHHAVSLRSLAPRLRAHVPAQCRTLLRCVLGTSHRCAWLHHHFTKQNRAVWQKNPLRFLHRINSADCLKEQLEPYGTLLLFPDHVSLIRYLMQGTSPPSSLQRSITWKLRPSRGPVTAPRNLTRPA